ncbi:hypothetical protein [Salinibacter grassmerensis]|uniref:hypothetical protein n=1 Tax=Salinibacter grassmerensis TaxID=3040353 RepID=UPI0021E77BF1|nr:hypothetical protein [Salinibacter grassmerensis]
MSVFPTDAMCAQPAPSASLPALYSLRIDVDYLSADLVRGHETGTEGEHLAAQYLVQRVRERGLAPGLDRAWTQPFDVTHSPNPHAPSGHGRPRTGRNVLAHLDRGAERSSFCPEDMAHLFTGSHDDHHTRGDQPLEAGVQF